MVTKTFPGGVHLSENKELTVEKKIKEISTPKVITIPISQHIGAPNEPKVKIGDKVLVGQKIGEAKAFVSAPVHASVSGVVKEIVNSPDPVRGKAPAVMIENDEKLDSEQFITRSNPEILSKEELLNIVKDAGIVGMGGATFPTHVKLNIPESKKVDTLIVNGAECEPYLTCDHRLMADKTSDILKGVAIIARIINAKKIFIAIEENKLSAIFAMEKAISKIKSISGNILINVVTLKTKYPQGGEKQLIKAILKKEVPPGKLPLDIGIVVQNVGTCFAIYEAVYKGKPLIERCLTLTGDCLNEPGNVLVKIGTPIKDVVNAAGGFKEKPVKIISGGPMMGIAQYSLDAPVTKGTTGIVFLSKKEIKLYEETPCIRCAKCVDICPINMIPTDIMRMVKYSRWHYIDKLNPTDCMECGSCAYTCPSRIPLVQYIKLAKIKSMEKKNG